MSLESVSTLTLLQEVAISMMIFGPVAEAARGGHSSSLFDLLVGSIFLVITWAQYFRVEQSKGVNIWISIGISAICSFFIWSGLAALI